ncbi:uncharacterized protein LOC128286813 [Gossypium arboreum]|uniref:uncharacterized protein LOC128286813 n=1 Tax=Gossypium arboreum TaxID=29729 RepID=UPI0022F14EEC|nr:uncharacterized protein LOC128286813 [Gossypium arboreum]
MSGNGAFIPESVVKPTHLSQILEEQMKDSQCDRFKQRMEFGKAVNFSIRKDVELRFKNIMFVPTENELRKNFLKEAHQRPYLLHPESIKMYKDLKGSYWWACMKREIVEYASTYLTCQRIKDEHEAPSDKLYPLEIP